MAKTGWLILCFLLSSCAAGTVSDAFVREQYERGCVLRKEGKAVEAMQCFIDASQTRTDDHQLLGRVYANMANMCRQAERHETAYEVYTQSAEQFLIANDTLLYAYALNNMAWEQAVMGDKTLAIALADSACRVCKEQKVVRKTYETRAAACLYAEQYDSAAQYARQIEDPIYGSMLLAQAYSLTQQCDSALQYAQWVIKETTNPRYLDDCYYILAHCDSLAGRTEVLAWTAARTDVQRELEAYKSEMAQAVLLLEQSRHPKHKIYIVLLVLLSVGGLSWLVYSLWLRHRLRTMKDEQATRQADRLREIEQLGQRLRQSTQPKKTIPWQDFTALCTYGDAHLFGMPGKLLARGLSEREVRLSLLVLLGFSYAEMADILNRAENGIGKDKYLIAKKLGVSARDLQATLLEMACKN